MNLSPQQQALLNQLNDIQLPEAVGFWPPSHLLLVVIVGVSGFLMWGLWYQWYRYRMNIYRKEGQNLLEEKLQNAKNDSEKVLIANQVIKQVAMTNFGRHLTASLTGEAWFTFLQNTCSYISQPDDLQQILQTAYQGAVDAQQQATFIQYAEAWIRGHHK